jgi:1-acyl-sn-glycerol-3-phosphate acyltransferase
MIKTCFVFFITGLTVVIFIPFGVLAFFLSFFWLRKAMSFFIYKIAQIWAFNLIKLANCNISILGKENIPHTGGVCFISNHGSIFDIILALAYIGRPFGFIAKKELSYIPFFNMWIYILGGLFIDRKNPRKALKTINSGIRRLKAGGGMLVFPEGHRSQSEGLLPFHSGSFKLATQSGVPIIPVSISGSHDVFEKYHKVSPADVQIVFGKPVDTGSIAPENRKQILSDRVRSLIEAGLRPVSQKADLG